MSEVKCNCPWNPDSHAETCPVYMREQIDTLRAANQRLETELSAIRGTIRTDNSAVIAGLQADNQRLEVERKRWEALAEKAWSATDIAFSQSINSAIEIVRLREALEQIVAQYPNPNISHVDYRVHACKCAEAALASTSKEVQ